MANNTPQVRAQRAANLAQVARDRALAALSGVNAAIAAAIAPAVASATATATGAASTATAQASAAAAAAATATTQAGAVAAAMNSSNAPYANTYASTLPMGVTSGVIGGTAITGATPGTYALTPVGGSITGVQANLVVLTATTARIDIINTGLGAGSTPPTWANPAGATLPSGTTLTAVVSSLIPDQKTYWAANSDSSQILLCGNNRSGGVDTFATAPFGGAQLSLKSSAAIDAYFSRLQFKTSTLTDLGVTADGAAVVAGFYDESSNMLFGIDALNRVLIGGVWMPIGKAMTLGRDILTASAESNYALSLFDDYSNPLTGFNTDDNSWMAPILRATQDLTVGGTNYLSNVAALRKDRLTRWRYQLSAIADGGSNLAALGLIGDSWSYFSTLFTPRLQSRLRAAYGDGGDGFISFATSSGLPSAPAAVSRTSGAVFTIITPVGTWNANTSYTAPTANLTEQVSAASGNRLQIAAVGASVNTVFKLLYRPIAGSSVRYSWDGGATWQATLDLSAGYVAALANVPVSGTWTLLIEDNGASARCALTGLNARKASGVLIHKVGSPGSTSAQWAAQAGTAGFQAHWAELAPDAISILLSSNDQTNGAVPADVATNYSTIRTGVRTGVPWTNQPPVDLLYAVPAENLRGLKPAMADYLSAIRKQALADGAAFLDLQPAVGSPAATAWWADTLHPNETYGAPAMARAFLEILDR